MQQHVPGVLEGAVDLSVPLAGAAHDLATTEHVCSQPGLAWGAIEDRGRSGQPRVRRGRGEGGRVRVRERTDVYSQSYAFASACVGSLSLSLPLLPPLHMFPLPPTTHSAVLYVYFSLSLFLSFCVYLPTCLCLCLSLVLSHPLSLFSQSPLDLANPSYGTDRLL